MNRKFLDLNDMINKLNITYLFDRNYFSIKPKEELSLHTFRSFQLKQNSLSGVEIQRFGV